ncbi:CHAT domain-containing protein [Flavobacteriaceae bacterium F08102]|nr:CHAT domain-containing protein [Flavobacteriaceae bacterium F08102]
MKFSTFLIVLCFVLVGNVNAQHGEVLKKIDSLIVANKFLDAEEILKTEIKKPRNLLLGHLLYPLGKIEFLQNPKTDFKNALDLYAQIATRKFHDTIAYEANLGMGLLYIDQGTPLKAQNYLIEGNRLAHKMRDVHRLVESEFYLSELGLKTGDFEQLIEHTNKALCLIRNNAAEHFSLAPRIYNYKGALMHFSAKPDSANYYYEKAVNVLDASVSSTAETDYLLGTIYGNWFMVKQSAGNFDEAMRFTLKSISHFNAFENKTNNHPLTEKVRENLTIAYRNLGSLYVDLGEKEKAKKIAMLGYNHAKKYFLKNTIPYFSAALMVGESLLYNNELEAAETYLEEANTSLIGIQGGNYSYKANLYGVLGELAYNKGDYQEAVNNYRRTLEAYKQSNEQGFSQNEVYTQINLARSYSNLNKFAEGIRIINHTLEEVISVYGEHSYLANEVRIAKVKIFFDKKEYKNTIKLSNQILDSYRSQSFNNLISKEFFSPNQLRLLLYLIKAQYEMDTVKTVERLKEITNIIEDAIQRIERKKSFITDQDDINTLLENSRELFDFGKKVYRKMYDISGDKKQLEKIIELHESSIYRRIRTRLNLTVNKLTPENIREKEDLLRKKINSFFDTTEDTQFDVEDWKASLRAWEEYLSTVKMSYPQYYELRYSTVLTPLDELQKNIDTLSTAVRYMFIENELVAFIITNDHMEMVALPSNVPVDCISTLSDYRKKSTEVSECLIQLYKSLWEPIQNKIKTENIIIFPDRALFNLNFELLTSEKINSFKDLTTKSLLANYNISYNYSLLLLDDKRNTLDYNNDFVAYAPTFDESMKSAYKMAINDSIALDEAYLTLLPQPFIAGIAERFSNRFGGRAFLNQNASKTIFNKTANEHKIIHIGTHAESNNVNPELSRLVFAKNISDATHINDNYLYTYEIYNQNFNANLAILTACETGKPSYQPGEGMISLAHAFNYAGSKSILTSLWQIDEQSSSLILDRFFRYLESGLSKDEALRNAKLDYIRHADGRTLHPQYWAGLILMGDTYPIDLSTSIDSYWYFIMAVLLVVVFVLIRSKRKTSDSH